MLETDLKDLLDYIISQKTIQKREETLRLIESDYTKKERLSLLEYVIKKRKETTTLSDWTILVQIENRIF